MENSFAASSDTDEADWERMMEEEPSHGGVSDTDEDNGDEHKEGLNPLMRLSVAQVVLPGETDPQDGPRPNEVVQGGNRRTSGFSSSDEDSDGVVGVTGVDGVTGDEAGVSRQESASSRAEEGSGGVPQPDRATTPPPSLDAAILSEDFRSVNQFLRNLNDEERAGKLLMACCRHSWTEETALIRVAKRGNVDMLLGVLTEAVRRCGMREILVTLPSWSKLKAMVRPVQAMLDTETSGPVRAGEPASARAPPPLHRLGATAIALFLALDRPIGKVVEVVLPIMAEYEGISPSKVDPVLGAATKSMVNGLGFTLFSTAVQGPSDDHMVDNLDALLRNVVKRLPADELKDAFAMSLRRAARAIIRPELRDDEAAKRILQVVTVLVKHGGKPSARELIRLCSRNASGICTVEMLQDCFLRAVESARNPFVPGISLSVALSDATRAAPKEYQQMFRTLQEGVDKLVLRILEGLPQTVRAFPHGMEGCCALFEPETTGELPVGFAGPLRLLTRREEQMRTFCVSSLVMDYLSRKYTRGLPNMRDTEEAIKEGHGLSYLRSKGLVGGGAQLQGEGDSGRSTYLRGARFVIVGVLARPADYYRVPSLRMMWDLIVYMVMLVLFNRYVLMSPLGQELTWAEGFLLVYIVAAFKTEIRELALGLRTYTRDRWNTLDLLALIFLTSGFVTRIVDSDNSWGRGFYALSSPIVLSRLLFFAQLFRIQGPMVQVIFAMTTELYRFAVVMIVVVLGFVNALYALLLNKAVSYGETWQTVFSAMLGDVGIFEYFTTDEQSSTVGVILVVVYFAITNIMLLNLLIGLLTTEYEHVQEEIDVEFKLSRTRLMQHYGTMVEKDWLPAPFNLVQVAVASPFFLVDLCFQSKLYRTLRAVVGSLIFWMVSGLLAVPLGSLLWIMSVPRAVWVSVERRSAIPAVPPNGIPAMNRGLTSGESEAAKANARSHLVNSSQGPFSGVLGPIVVILECAIVAPLCLLGLWIRGAVMSVTGAVVSSSRDSPDSVSDDSSQIMPVDGSVTVGGLLMESLGMTVTKIRQNLDNPMADPEVHEDEKSMKVTVEHLKLLRHELQDQMVLQNLRPLIEDVSKGIRNMETSLGTLAGKLSAMDGRMEKVEQTLQDVLARGPAGDGRVENG